MEHAPSSTWSGTAKTLLVGTLTVWFAAAYVIGVEHILANDTASLLAPVAITAVIPVAIFVVLYTSVERFRRYVLAFDLRDLTMLQHWRVIGLGFLILYGFNELPALFAWPAGIGDVAIGVAAFFVVRRLDRDPGYASSNSFVRFHLLGLLDFVVAVITAGLASGALPGLVADGLTSAPMDVWPLSIFPSFIVPAFIILHVIVLLKVRALRRSVADPNGLHLSAT